MKESRNGSTTSGLEILYREIWESHFRTNDSGPYWEGICKDLAPENIQSALLHWRDHRRSPEYRSVDLSTKPLWIRWIRGKAAQFSWDSKTPLEQQAHNDAARAARFDAEADKRNRNHKVRQKYNLALAGLTDDLATGGWRRHAVEVYTYLQPQRDSTGRLEATRCPMPFLRDSPHNSSCSVCGGTGRADWPRTYQQLSRDSHAERWMPILQGFLENGITKGVTGV